MLSGSSKFSVLFRKTAINAVNTTGNLSSIKSIRHFAVAPPKKNDDVAKVKTKKGPVKANLKKKSDREDDAQSDAVFKFLTSAEDSRK